MNNLIKIMKKIKKTTLLEKILIIVIFCAIVFLINSHYNTESFDNKNTKKELIKKDGSEVFDEYYVSVYDDLVYDEIKNNYEVGRIINSNKPTRHSKVLDIGCGTGHHVYLLNTHKIKSVIGIDNSPAMIEQARENYPGNDFKLCSALDTMEFPADSFTHITCLNQTIYYIKDKKQLLKNCYQWLMPGGTLALHLLDIDKFDPIIPIARESGIITPDKRPTKSTVKFTTLDYISDFIVDKNIKTDTANMYESNAMFKEIFKFKDSNKKRVNEHKLYMPTQKSILNMAKRIGFIVKSQEEYEMKPHNYLYILEKP